MVVEKIKNNNLYDLCLTSGTKIFRIMFAPNLDVYWYFKDVSSSDRSGKFEITKENYKVYELFDKLYNCIKDGIVFENTDFDIYLCNSVKELEELYESRNKRNFSYKYISNYDELFHDGIITWKCDDFSHDEPTNMVNIYKDEDKYILEFLFNEEKYFFTTIRFRNSGSYYDPFNLIFMRMYNSFQDIDFDDGQIHMEEYLYEKKKTLQRVK